LSRPSLTHLQFSLESTSLRWPLNNAALELPLITGNGTVICNISTPPNHPFVPSSLRRKVSCFLHNLSHTRSRATDYLVSDRFFWTGMSKDMKAWTHACLACQRSKVQRHNKAPIGIFPTLVQGPATFTRIFCSCLFTCVVRFTRCPKANHLPDFTISTAVKTFISRWIPIFGALSTIMAQFKSNLLPSLLSFLGFTRIRMTTYHPADNGMVEQFHRQLKASLRAAEDPGDWTDYLHCRFHI
uniref:Integrase_H2C2 domain-containing protein n=1 Tax=Schistocephalus solidus TaxID=70667 RepID=A0A183T9P5_SCHSO